MENLNQFFIQEFKYYSNNRNVKYLVSFGLGTTSSIKQEYDKYWIKKIEDKFFNPKYYKVFYLIDQQYNFIGQDDKHKFLEKYINERCNYIEKKKIILDLGSIQLNRKEYVLQ